MVKPLTLLCSWLILVLSFINCLLIKNTHPGLRYWGKVWEGLFFVSDIASRCPRKYFWPGWTSTTWYIFQIFTPSNIVPLNHKTAFNWDNLDRFVWNLRFSYYCTFYESIEMGFDPNNRWNTFLHKVCNYDDCISQWIFIWKIGAV